jgi:glyoxylase-like metal-dependent hydrolase (beta-lactamase superfamily II)
MERISLSNHAFEGNNNVYLFDGPETVLIDSGDRMDSTREHLRERLAAHDVTFADVDRIFLTHWRGAHTGLAGEIQAAGGAEVYVHAEDAPLVEGDDDAWDEMFELQERYFDAWAMPEAKQAVLLDRRMGADALGTTPDVTTFEDGDVFTFAGADCERELRVVHASGHAKGLSLFEFDGDAAADGGTDGAPGDPASHEVFSGDALLPVYTPNVGGADVRVDRPLEKYLRALRRIVDAGYARAWPGHRDPIDDPADRASFIVHHHEDRAWRVLDTLRRLGPTDTWTVSAELFGELESIHILHGPGESYAHLEHLERAGEVVREEADDGVWQYELADGVAEELDALDEEHWPLE